MFKTVLFIALFWLAFIFVTIHYQATIAYCQTGGAKMHSRSTDGNLHLTLWCTKNGKVVK